MNYVLGVDGGNSKTLAAVATTDGRLRGLAKAGGSNHERIGFAETERVLAGVTGESLAQAEVKAPVQSGFWGLAGADVPSDFAALEAIVKRAGVARKNVVKNDLAAAMAAGLSRPWGVGIVFGAGFSAGAVAPDGREIKMPSMGAVTGDWGGGEVLALEVLRLAHRSHDGRGRKSRLEDGVLRALGLTSYEELPTRVRENSLEWHEASAALPPLLFAAAAAGDDVARDLVVRVGEEVALTAMALIDRLGLRDLDVEVVLGGSVLRGEGPLLLETIRTRIMESCPRARIILPDFHPVVGAVIEALRSLGVEVDDRVRGNIRKSLPASLRLRPAGEDRA